MIPSLTDNFGLDGSDNVPNASLRKSYVSTYEPLEEEREGQGEKEAPEKEAGVALESEDDHDFEAGPDPDDDGEIDLDDAELISMVREAEAQATTYMQSVVRTAWNRSLKAFRNEHFEGSKYLSDQYRGRSKIFRPKTRSAVRKNLATAAEALFSTADVVTIAAQNEADPMQVASAAIKNELLNYRLERSSGVNGIPWFQVAMGMRQDSQVHGICVSKQSWLYKERKTGRVHEEIVDTGDGSMFKARHEEREILVDRPDINPIPPENVLIDPAAFWINPAQNSKYLIIRYPMHPSAVMEMMESSVNSPLRWKPITVQELRSKANAPADAANTRRAREGGIDPKDTNATGTKFRVVWVYEVFLNHEGEDWNFWSLGANRLLCSPSRTRDVYPWLNGERPVVMGYGSLDAHRLFPMSPVESWQQLQQEGNDIANLRLDQMKHVVSPVAKVKRGKSIDLTQIQRRGPNTVVMVSDMDDMEWDRPPDVPQSAYMEANYLNADFDDLAGAFNSSSVNTNRELNETVGGMRLLAGNASTVTEYDLRVWVETWVEPVLWQVVKLEEWYENDEKVLAVAGERARAFQRFGVDAITDKLLMAECLVRVNVGTGASTTDPMQKIAKFQAAMQTAQQALQPFFDNGSIEIMPKTENILSEIFGDAGYKDGGERFFSVTPQDQVKPKGPPPDPKAEAQKELIAAKTDAVKQQAQIKAVASQQKLQHTGILAQIKTAAAAQTAKIKAADAAHGATVKAIGDRHNLAMQAAGAHVDHAAKVHGAHADIVTRDAQLHLDEQKHKVEEDRIKLEKEKIALERDREKMKQQFEKERMALQKEKVQAKRAAPKKKSPAKKLSFHRNAAGDIVGATIQATEE